jgi:hypothetical protein
MRAKHVTLVLVLGLAIVTIGVGFTWTWMNLGDVPGYGDSHEYVQIASKLKVDRYRGILYPAVLSLVRIWREDPDTVQYYRDVQLIQLCVFIVSLAYFLYVIADTKFLRNSGRRAHVVVGLGLLFALLFFDPLIAHFNLSIMPDGLALSGSLIFCAAFADLGVRRTHPAIAGIALLLGHLLTAGVRVEKNVILVTTTVITVVIWITLSRRQASPMLPHLRRHAVIALFIVATGFGIVLSVHRAFYEPSVRWPTWISVAHNRIIFPNLRLAYDDLPESVRSVIHPEDARIYDLHLRNAWAVMNDVTGNDPERLDQLTRELLIPVLRARWPAIAGSIVTDTTENILAPFSFYARLTRWICGGAKESVYRGGEATSWTYHNLAKPHPWSSGIFVALSASIFVVTAMIAMLYARARVRDRGWSFAPRVLIMITPCAAFIAVNALAFAATVSLVHIRYTILAHALFMFLFYVATMRWLLSYSNGRR